MLIPSIAGQKHTKVRQRICLDLIATFASALDVGDDDIPPFIPLFLSLLLPLDVFWRLLSKLHQRAPSALPATAAIT